VHSNTHAHAGQQFLLMRAWSSHSLTHHGRGLSAQLAFDWLRVGVLATEEESLLTSNRYAWQCAVHPATGGSTGLVCQRPVVACFLSRANVCLTLIDGQSYEASYFISDSQVTKNTQVLQLLSSGAKRYSTGRPCTEK
jgi:hypothetical protein